MSYKNPVIALLPDLKGLDNKIQDISQDMQNSLLWLSQCFGLADRAVEFRDGKEYIYPACYNDKNYIDPQTMMPNDTISAFCFWVKEADLRLSNNNPVRNYYKISCIFYMDLRRLAPYDNYKSIKTQIRQDIMDFFRTHIYGGYGVLVPVRIIDDDLTQVYKGFSVSQLDNVWRQLPKYALRYDFDFAFLMSCPNTVFSGAGGASIIKPSIPITWDSTSLTVDSSVMTLDKI